jgi:hypothetical protein
MVIDQLEESYVANYQAKEKRCKDRSNACNDYYGLLAKRRSQGPVLVVVFG